MAKLFAATDGLDILDATFVGNGELVIVKESLRLKAHAARSPRMVHARRGRWMSRPRLKVTSAVAVTPSNGASTKDACVPARVDALVEVIELGRPAG